MWSSPAALVKVNLSASRLSTGPQSFCSQAAYQFRTSSPFVKFCPPNALALAGPGRLTAPTSAQAPVASRLLRDTTVVVIVPVIVIVRSPFHDAVRSALPDRDAGSPSIRTGWYVAVPNCSLRHRCDQPRLRLPGGRRDRSQSTMFLIPAFITFGS